MTGEILTHNGIVIELQASGSFAAVIGGTRLVRTTMKAMRKAIDDAKGFEPFVAFVQRRGGFASEDHLEEVRIVGVAANGRKGRNAQMFWKDNRGGTHHRVTRKTDKTAKAAEKLNALSREIEEQKSALDRKLEEAMEPFEGRSPSEEQQDVLR